MKKTNLMGCRFGNWVVIGATDRKPSAWQCRCDCGTASAVRAGHLVSGMSSSCGCARMKQGGLSTTREYKIWANMIKRCHDPRWRNWQFYGAMGIYVCERWRGSFQDFLADVGPAPSAKHTLDRADTKGSYTCGECSHCQRWRQPANCRWVTKAVQSRNQKSNRYYTHDGQTLILKDWARLTGIPYITLWNRLNTGMPFADAITVKRYDRKAIIEARQS